MKKIFLITLFFFISNSLYASTKIVYIDINKILNESVAGKKVLDKLENDLKKANKKFIDTEEKIKKEEKKIISQKNIISKEEYEKKLVDLRKMIADYQIERRKNISEFNEKKNVINKKLIELINPIIADYASSEDISLVIRKEQMVIGKTELDISKNILKIVNKKIKEIK